MLVRELGSRCILCVTELGNRYECVRELGSRYRVCVRDLGSTLGGHSSNI